jgi:hypothetical protein
MRKLVLLLSAAVLVTACAPRYDATLLTSIEGRWMCDVQRYAFTDASDIQTELDGRLAADGVTVEQYRRFKDDLARRATLRDQVRAAYDQVCVAS